MSDLFSPVLDLKTFESGVVHQVECYEDEVVRSGYGGDLPIRERRGSPGLGQTRAFGGVPSGSTVVVGQDLDRRCHDSMDIFLDRRTPLGSREPVAAEEQLVPDDRSGGELLLMFLEPIE